MRAGFTRVSHPDHPRIQDRPKFAYRGGHSVYVNDHYTDEHGNQWVIRVVGVPEVVQAFREKGRIEVGAQPLDIKEWEELYSKWQALEQECDTGVADRAPEAHPHEPPTLQIAAVLVRRKFDQRLFRTSYRVFVPDAGSSEHQHSLYAGDDGWAYCSYAAQGDPITIELAGSGGQTARSGAIKALSRATYWTVIVTKSAGTSYDLGGDSVHPSHVGP